MQNPTTTRAALIAACHTSRRAAAGAAFNSPAADAVRAASAALRRFDAEHGTPAVARLYGAAQG